MFFLVNLVTNYCVEKIYKTDDSTIWPIPVSMSTHETKQSSKFKSDPSPNCFTIDVRNINAFNSLFLTFFSFFFVSHFTRVL